MKTEVSIMKSIAAEDDIKYSIHCFSKEFKYSSK